MSNASQSAQTVCNHERRPGTTVCLHCRHAERIAAGERRKKLLLRGSALGIVLVVVGAAVWMSATVIQSRLSPDKQNDGEAATIVASAASTPAPRDSTLPAATVAANTPAPVAPNAGTVSQPPIAQQGISARPPLIPVIAPGESKLGDTITALRSDSVVMLSFDAPMLRTRRPDKFEPFLRTTLRLIYGAAIDSSLAKIPDGGLVGQGNLLYELPTRGIHIPVSATWKLDVFPEIRPGKDGPLVIRYRASLSPTP